MWVVPCSAEVQRLDISGRYLVAAFDAAAYDRGGAGAAACAVAGGAMPRMRGDAVSTSIVAATRSAVDRLGIPASLCPLQPLALMPCSPCEASLTVKKTTSPSWVAVA